MFDYRGMIRLEENESYLLNLRDLLNLIQLLNLGDLLDMGHLLNHGDSVNLMWVNESGLGWSGIRPISES